jgi:hypothetical protein
MMVEEPSFAPAQPAAARTDRRAPPMGYTATVRALPPISLVVSPTHTFNLATWMSELMYVCMKVAAVARLDSAQPVKQGNVSLEVEAEAEEVCALPVLSYARED